MTVLIFGVGYLGSALARNLLRDGERVVGVDNGFSTGWAALERLGGEAPGRFALLRGDVRDEADVVAAFRRAAPVTAVFLLAAQASAHPEAAPAAYTEETNLRGPRLVFDAALRHGAPPIVLGSSFHVYGDNLAGTIGESHPYGVVRDLSHLSKIYAEKLAEMYALRHGLAIAPVRLGVVYGVGPVMKRDLRFVTVPHAFAIRALARQPLEIHPSGRRPFALLHLDDAVAALRLAMPGAGYLPANAAGEVLTALDVARATQTAAAALGLSVQVLDRNGGTVAESAIGGNRPPQRFQPATRLEALGWRPRVRLRDALPGILAAYAGSEG